MHFTCRLTAPRRAPRANNTGRPRRLRAAPFVLTAALLLPVFPTVAAESPAPGERVEFNRDIRPILAEHCLACHGPDSAARKADLRLDQRAPLIERDLVVPGKADESELVRRILSTEAAEVMPPPSTKKKLTPAQQQLLARWVAEGADYQSHWSYLAPQRPATPTVQNSAWVRNPIDNFLLAQLEQHDLQPAPEADRRTLARRVSLDLTGLPPLPADVEAFVNDTAPDAYERYVDRLLESPHWGEHRGRYWLDAARYADTHGLHFDNYREMWPYRDWVIEAFNRNLPFDRFTVEQIAGDLLPDRTLDQQIASGFHRCNITTNEGGSIAEEIAVNYAKDRVETTATVWLGLTAGCAACHDHKFDAITQAEFYQFTAFFRNTTQNPFDGNIFDTPPTIVVPPAELTGRWNELLKTSAELRTRKEQRGKEISATLLNEWLKSDQLQKLAEPLDPQAERVAAGFDAGMSDKLAISIDGQATEHPLVKGLEWGPGHIENSFALHFKDNVSLDLPGLNNLDGTQPFSVGGWVFVPPGNSVIVSQFDAAGADKNHGWKLEVKGNRVLFTLIGDTPQDQLAFSPRTARITPDRWNHIFVTYDGSKDQLGLVAYVNGKPFLADLAEQVSIKGSIANSAPLRFGTDGVTGFKGGALQDFRLYSRTLSEDEVVLASKWDTLRRELQKAPGNSPPAIHADLAQLYALRFDDPAREIAAQLAQVEREQRDIRRRSSVTLVMQERTDTMPLARVLFRGEYDQPRDEVKPAVFAALHPFPKDAPLNRLGLAQWLVAPENPLMARVTVNRFWQEVFGTGLVRTAGDFGVSGEQPSHPELLDWMAVEFRESGWNVKAFFKLLVTSAAYRQSATVTPEKLEKDSQNRLLSRGPRFRMDAEMIRDYMLASSDIMARKIGGPSAKPYQPVGVWEAVAMIGSNTRDYRTDAGENLYRRSLYTFWKRAAPPASMDILNAPSREVCTVRRERTNTPLQALVTLNDPQFIEAARHLAQRALKQGGDSVEARIDFIAQRLLARSFRSEELAVVQQVLGDLQGYYQAHTEDAAKLIAVGDSKADPTLDGPTTAAWTMLVNQLMNLDEVLNK